MTTLNFNVGLLGHVDSGKTSLAKALSQVSSTACFDKNPQSQERGITLDLGFSSFTLPAKDSIKQSHGIELIQYTLVDCPGHASLIKTIIAGAQIIDMMILLIDIEKGVQTQTSECLIIGEICCEKLLIVINKIDLIDEAKRDGTIEKMKKRLLKTLEKTKFASNTSIVAVSAGSQLNMTQLTDTIQNETYVPNRVGLTEPFLMSIDHCFAIKGQGTVLTGTVLNGCVKVNDSIEIPSIKTEKKVKSIQVFKKPVEKACQGDRCGICLTNLDAKLIERGLACAPNFVRNCFGLILDFKVIRYFSSSISSGSVFHITIGHETILGKVTLFSETPSTEAKEFNFGKEYCFVPEITKEELDTVNSKTAEKRHYALIDFDIDNNHADNKYTLCSPNSLLIGSKLDKDINLNQCRIAFYGRIMHMFTNKDYKDKMDESVNSSTVNKTNPASYLCNLKVYKEKTKSGTVERKHDEQTVICKQLFKKESNLEVFAGLKVTLSTGEIGQIDGSFGQSGKVKIRVPSGLSAQTKEILESKGKGGEGKQEPIKVNLSFRKHIFDSRNKIYQ